MIFSKRKLARLPATINNSALTITLSISITLTSCSQRPADPYNRINNQTQSKDVREEWNRLSAELPQPPKPKLAKDGITLAGDGYLLSKELENNCTLNLQIGQFIWKVVSGTDNNTDRNFAHEHAQNIILIIQKVWNAPGFSTDGVHHEKYGLLSNNAFSNSEIEPFLTELVRNEGLGDEEDTGLWYVLFNRKLVPTPAVETRLKIAEKGRIIFEQFISLILLNQQGTKQEYILKLKRIARSPSLSKLSRQKATKIIQKLESKEDLTWNEIDDFELSLLPQ